MGKEEKNLTQADKVEEKDGWSAIDRVVHGLYPDQAGWHYGPQLPYCLGGPDPLDGLAVYSCEEGMEHWHYITYGFSELGEGETEEQTEESGKEEPGISGYGFELTFRLKKNGEEQPPVWPMNFLQNLARYVFQSGNVFGDGHHMNANGPIALEEDTRLTAIGFIRDPKLPPMDTPNGSVEFLEVVGITAEEMEALTCWNCRGVLGLLEKSYPLYVTDLTRASVLEEESARRIWEEGVKRDGSSTRFFYTDEFHFEPIQSAWKLRFGAGHADLLCRMLRARVEKGRELVFYAAEQSVMFLPGEGEITAEENTITVPLTDKNICELCALLKQQAGSYVCKTIPLVVELVPTLIRDQDGKITKTIG